MPLTDVAAKKAKSKTKPFKLFDGGGLFLLVAQTGAKLWRLKYRFAGKEKLLALGAYPDVSLADSRAKRDDARRLLADGIDPSAQRRIAKAAAVTLAANTLQAIAEEWLLRFQESWASSHLCRVKARLASFVYPWLGSRPIAEITPPEILAVLRRVEARGRLETAHRVRTHLSMLFRFAIATGRAERDPTADLKGALPAADRKHMAAVTDPVKLADLLRAIWSYEGTPIVAAALKLAPMLFVRPGELRSMRWADVDFAKAEWRYTASKTDTPHIVPLARQALAVLRDLRPLTGLAPYVFPSLRDRQRPMSNAAVNAALRRLGIEKDVACGHGFRATARTLLDEVLGFRVDLIEAQLAHNVKDPLGRAYNRTAFLSERKAMMQKWADYLDALAAGNVADPVGQPMPGKGSK